MIRKPYSRREKKLLQELQRANKAVQDQVVYSGKLLHEIAEINKIKDEQKSVIEKLSEESELYRENFEDKADRVTDLETALKVVIALK